MTNSRFKYQKSIAALFACYLLFFIPVSPLVQLYLSWYGVLSVLWWQHKSRRLSFIFFLSPLIATLIYFNYDANSFLYLGDGHIYKSIYDDVSKVGLYEYFLSNYAVTHNLLTFFKVSSLGSLPTFYVGEHLFGSDTKSYYLVQCYLLTFSIAIASTVFLKFKSFQTYSLFIILLFSTVSPTFFELGSAPTRHYITFVGLLLLSVSTFELTFYKKSSYGMMIWLLAILLVVISKFVYILLYFSIVMTVFVAYLVYKRRFFYLVSMLFIMCATLIYFKDYIEYTYSVYINYSHMGMGIFDSNIIGIPGVGWILKYIYAILSPFPWSNVHYNVSVIYGGNSLMYMMHIFSSLTGIYIVVSTFSLILKKDLPPADSLYFCLFGLLFSSSILAGATGFHGYLSIFFPFMMPAALHEKHVIPMLLLTFVIGMSFEAIYHLREIFS